MEFCSIFLLKPVAENIVLVYQGTYFMDIRLHLILFLILVEFYASSIIF